MTPVLQTETLTKRFDGVAAVNEVSMEVAKGERRAIIGPNGAGKSTFFNLLSGHISPSGGRVAIFGKDVTGKRPEQIARMGVGRSFQVTSVFPELTVFENVQVALMARERLSWRIFGRAWRALRDDARAVLDDVGLGSLSETPSGMLSHGDQRTLELAISLALRPQLLFLDEPTAGMAPEETHRAMDLVRRLASEYELTLIFTEHDMEVVFATADTITVLADGRVIADGATAEVRAHPAVREVYLGAAS